MSDTHMSFCKRQKIGLPGSKFEIQFSEHNVYCFVGAGEKLNLR